MSWIDWVVLFGTLIFIVAYGVYKTRGNKDIDNYLSGGDDSKWWAIGLVHYGHASQCHHLPFYSGASLYRWNALCAVLLRFASRHDHHFGLLSYLFTIGQKCTPPMSI